MRRLTLPEIAGNAKKFQHACEIAAQTVHVFGTDGAACRVRGRKFTIWGRTDTWLERDNDLGLFVFDINGDVLFQQNFTIPTTPLPRRRAGAIH